ncbi:MAG: helix-turn-helix transcriptional regulator [Bacteroidales bacterium]|nr:helix-turn-helix transcriptional regulator [Bacteroidales bacterium]
MHIGNKIREVLQVSNMSVSSFAKAIHCTRENASRILAKEHIDTSLLSRICRALEHDFFRDLSNDNPFHHPDKTHRRM